MSYFVTVHATSNATSALSSPSYDSFSKFLRCPLVSVLAPLQPLYQTIPVGVISTSCLSTGNFATPSGYFSFIGVDEGSSWWERKHSLASVAPHLSLARAERDSEGLRGEVCLSLG